MDEIDIQTAEYLVKVANALKDLDEHLVWNDMAKAYLSEVTFRVEGEDLGFRLSMSGDFGRLVIIESPDESEEI